MVPGIGKLPMDHPDLIEDFKEAQANGIQLPYNLRSTITDIFDRDNKAPVPYPTAFNEDTCSGGYIDVVAGNQGAFKMILESSPVELQSSPFASLAQLTTPKLVELLVRFVTLPDIKENYDLIIIDPGPSESPLFTAALRAATHVVSPYEPEDKSMEGAAGLIDNVMTAMERRLASMDRKEPLKYIGMVPNSVRHNNEHLSNIVKAQELAGKYHFPEHILVRQIVDISRLTKPYDDRPKPKSVARLKKTDLAYEDLSLLSEYVLQQMGVIGQ